MSPKRAQPKSRQSRDESGEVLNSPFRYAEDTTEDFQTDIESLRGPSVGQKRSSSGREIIMPNKDRASVLQGRSHTRS